MSEEAELPPGAELLWGDRQRPRRGRRPTLTLEQIVAEAIELVDSDGLQALSMQRLAERLGKGTMSLYRYVSNKDELIALMLDAAVGLPETVEDHGDDWRAALWDWAHRSRRIFRSHPWTLQLATSKRLMGPNETEHLEAALRAVSGLGLTGAQMLDTVLVINGFVRGAAQAEVDGTAGEPDVVQSYTPALAALLEAGDYHERFPTLLAVMEDGTGADSPERVADEGFEFGLACILDGVAAQLPR